MTLIEYDIEQRSDEWYAVRCGLITASVVGRLITPSTLAVASNDTSREVVARLAAERITGAIEPTFVTDDMFRGIEHEPLARDKYAEHHNVEVAEVGFMVREEKDWSLGYSPDGLIGEDGLLEVKCPRAKTHIRTIVEDQVPPFHLGQLQAGLFVTGRKWIDFVSFCAGLPMWTRRVLPDEQWFDAIEAATSSAEAAIQQMVRDYRAAIDDLPATERIDLELVISA